MEVLGMPEFSSESEDDDDDSGGGGGEHAAAAAAAAAPVAAPAFAEKEAVVTKREGIVVAVAPVVGASLADLFAAVVATATATGNHAQEHLAEAAPGGITWAFDPASFGRTPPPTQHQQAEDGPAVPDGIVELLLATCVVKDADAASVDGAGAAAVLAAVRGVAEVRRSALASLFSRVVFPSFSSLSRLRTSIYSWNQREAQQL